MDAPFIGTIFPFAGNFAPMYYATCWGQSYAVNQYQALYAILGNIYGGNTVNFLLPELRGRSLVGYGTSPTLGNWNQGVAQGSLTTAITGNNLPLHIHAATFTGTGGGAGGTQTVTIPASAGTQTFSNGSAAVNTSAAGTAATPTLTNGQTVYLTNAGAGSAGNTLRGLYTTTAPTAGTNSATIPVTGSITGTPGNPALSFTVPTGGGITGGTVAVQPGGGVSNPLPVSVVQPVLAINFIIAIQGLFPTRD